MCGKLKGAASDYTRHGYRLHTRREQQNTLSHTYRTGLALRRITWHGMRESEIGGEFGENDEKCIIQCTIRSRHACACSSDLWLGA